MYVLLEYFVISTSVCSIRVCYGTCGIVSVVCSIRVAQKVLILINWYHLSEQIYLSEHFII